MVTRIKDFGEAPLDVYARLTENQLYHYYEPYGGLFLAESEKVIWRALEAGYEPVSLLMEESYLGKADALLQRLGDLPVYLASTDVLSQLTGYVLTRGILCAMRRRPLPDVEEVLAGARRVAVLECVMNPANVGAIIRSAAALCIDAVLLTPGSSDPLYRRAIRVSMGNVFLLPWTFLPAWPGEGMGLLKRMGFTTVAMALREDSLSLSDTRLQSIQRMAIVLGTEGEGLRGETMAECDYRVKIPMSNGVDSLNVAAASAVAFWELAGKQGT